MDILINGVEIPKPADEEMRLPSGQKFRQKGLLHLVITSDGEVFRYTDLYHEPVSLGYAKALPSHSDLIDRMELAMNVAKAQEELKGKDIDPFMLLGDVLRWIALAPTVLEADNADQSDIL